jgi:hypothetical protein
VRSGGDGDFVPKLVHRLGRDRGKRSIGFVALFRQLGCLVAALLGRGLKECG